MTTATATSLTAQIEVGIVAGTAGGTVTVPVRLMTNALHLGSRNRASDIQRSAFRSVAEGSQSGRKAIRRRGKMADSAGI